jgi:hypothetical protein
MVYTLRFFPLQNTVRFIILRYLVPVLFTFYIQGVLKLKENNSGAKRLKRGKIHIVSRHVKQGVFVLLSEVYMHPFKWLQVCVVGRFQT